MPDRTELSAESDTGLAYGERLLIWSWRKIVMGQGGCPLIAKEFACACGEDAGEVLATFYTFLRALAYAGRRSLRVGHPGCPGVTGDERQLLVLIAAAQAGDTSRFDANLRWLARSELCHVLIIASQALGSAFSAHGLDLRLPSPIKPCARMALPAERVPDRSSAIVYIH